MEAPDEKGHFYLSEVPTYDQLIESDRKLSEDLERKTSIIPTQDFTENGTVTSTDLALEKLLDNLDRDVVISDFDELPSLDF